MLLKTDSYDEIINFIAPLTGPDPGPGLILVAACVLFLIGGLGTRLIGLAGVVRAAAGSRAMRDWLPMAWMILVGIALSFVLVINPFPNSIQTYLLALFLLWPFAVRVIWPRHAGHTLARWLATAALVALSVPATLHYVRAAHAAAANPPIKDLGAGDQRVIDYLETYTSSDDTMLLHSDPLMPSVYAVEAERRVVLGWSSYVSEDFNPEVLALEARISAFFGAPGRPGAPDLDLLEEHGVTHVIERTATDELARAVRERLTLVAGTPDVRLYAVAGAH